MFGKKSKYVDHKLVRYTFFDGVKDAGAFLIRFFSKKNLFNSIKNVLAGFREYLVFFIAMFLIQGLFWSSAIFADSRSATIKETAHTDGGYTLMIDRLTENEWTAVYNSHFYISDNLSVEKRMYESYRNETYTDAWGNKLVQVEFVLPEDSMEYCVAFLDKYNLGIYSDNIYYGTGTESLRVADGYVRSGNIVILAVGLLSAVVLLVLFLIRVNHYKFRYGIYMSFGASFGKLFEITTWELFSIGILTFIPSFVITCVFSALVIVGSGGVFAVGMTRFIQGVIWLFAVVLAAVLPSVVILSKQAPVILLRAADNSNLVSSPRRSFRIFYKKFPTHYELFSFWRFRKYYAGLLISATLFSSMFLCGVFTADLLEIKENSAYPKFIASTGVEQTRSEREENPNSDITGIEEDEIDQIVNIDGVRSVTWESSVYATEVMSHLVLTRSQSSGISSKRVSAQQKGMYADNNFKFVSVNDLLYSQVAGENNDMWHIQGDLSSIYSTDECVIAISREINNQTVMNFKVGDTVIIGIFDEWGEKVQFEKPDRKYILRKLLERDRVYYNFIEARVGAVIDTADGDDAYTVAVSPEVYKKLTGRNESIETLNIYLDDGISGERSAEIFKSVRKIMSYYQNYTLTDTMADANKETTDKIESYIPVVMGASVMLGIAALVWFFSQAMFLFKRQKENYMLSSFGATDKQLSKLYLFSGVVLTAAASVAAAGVGSFVSYLIYYFVNIFLPSLGMGDTVRYEYNMSFGAFAVCVAVSALSAITATYLPFRRYCRERDNVARAAAGEGR